MPIKGAYIEAVCGKCGWKIACVLSATAMRQARAHCVTKAHQVVIVLTPNFIEELKVTRGQTSIGDDGEIVEH